jgi:hypothetical protein
MDIQRLLRQQHVALRLMLQELRGTHADRRVIVFEMLSDAVLHHWAVEEHHLYPLLEGRGYDNLHRSIELHRDLCHVVCDLRGLCNDGPHFFSALKVLGAHIEQHIIDEEQCVLPFVARTVDPAESRAVGERMAETLAEIENDDWLGSPDAWQQPAL